MIKRKWFRPTLAMIETLSGINELLENGENTTITDIANFLGVPYNIVYQRLQNYLAYELVVVDSDGNFSLTEEGINLLEELS